MVTTSCDGDTNSNTLRTFCRSSREHSGSSKHASLYAREHASPCVYARYTNPGEHA